MKFVVAGGGVAGLAAALAVARAGHEVVVVERDSVEAGQHAAAAFGVERRGIPHYFQPHAFLPRGRWLLAAWAPDVLDLLVGSGANPQDLAAKLHGPGQPGDEELVYLWGPPPGHRVGASARCRGGADDRVSLGRPGDRPAYE